MKDTIRWLAGLDEHLAEVREMMTADFHIRYEGEGWLDVVEEDGRPASPNCVRTSSLSAPARRIRRRTPAIPPPTSSPNDPEEPEALGLRLFHFQERKNTCKKIDYWRCSTREGLLINVSVRYWRATRTQR